MPKKLPSSGMIQFGKQLDMFEEAVKDAADLGNDAVAQAHAQLQKKIILDLFDKKGKS